MREDTDTDVFPDLSAAALREWQELTDHILHGVAHSLNNRAAAVAAVLDLAKDPTEDPAPTISILGSELERVQELVSVVRLISSSAAAPDAFSPTDVAGDVERAITFHTELRDRSVDFELKATQPIRVPRWMFVRALLALVANASRAVAGISRAKVIIADDGDWIVARVETSSVAAEPSSYVSEIAAAMGGELLPEGHEVGFRLPTLAAIRRREGR